MRDAVALHGIVEGGDGPPVVILHGLLGSSRNWYGIAASLSATYRVHALDLRNHGRSPWAADCSYAAMAADVARYIADHNLERPTVIGHSMGGKVAMMLALSRPEAIGALVVADVAPVSYRNGFLAFIQAMRAIDLAPLKRRSEAEALLEPAVPSPAVRKFLTQNLQIGEGGLHWRVNLDALAAGMSDITGFPELPGDARYGGPALFLAGEASNYVRTDHHGLIRRHFPRATFATVPKAGHWLHADNPEGFLARLQPFLAEAAV